MGEAEEAAEGVHKSIIAATATPATPATPAASAMSVLGAIEVKQFKEQRPESQQTDSDHGNENNNRETATADSQPHPTNYPTCHPTSHPTNYPTNQPSFVHPVVTVSSRNPHPQEGCDGAHNDGGQGPAINQFINDGSFLANFLAQQANKAPEELRAPDSASTSSFACSSSSSDPVLDLHRQHQKDLDLRTKQEGLLVGSEDDTRGATKHKRKIDSPLNSYSSSSLQSHRLVKSQKKRQKIQPQSSSTGIESSIRHDNEDLDDEESSRAKREFLEAMRIMEEAGLAGTEKGLGCGMVK